MIIKGGGILVKVRRPKSISLAKFKNVFERVEILITADADTNPELAAVIPSSDALTARYFFRLSQNRITKKIKNVPGRKIPRADISAPIISPPVP